MAGERGPLRVAIENWWNDWNPDKRIRAWVQARVEAVERMIVNAFPGLYDVLEKMPPLPPPFDRMLPSRRAGMHEVDIISAIGTLFGVGLHTAAGLWAPVSQWIHYEVNYLLRPNRITEAHAVAEHYTREGTLDDAIDAFRWQGWTDKNALKLIELAQQLVPVGTLIEAYHRGVIPPFDFHKKMKQHAIMGEDADLMAAMADRLPGIGDLLHFATVWGDDERVIATYGLDQAMPGWYIDEAAKVGVGEHDARRYWWAHWSAPAINQIIEAYQRFNDPDDPNFISQGDLNTWLTIAGVPDFWRKRLIALADQPLSRLDIRRLYQYGQLDEAGVLAAYRAQGYSWTNAQHLTNATVLGYADAEKDLSQSDIVSAYTDGIITRALASDNLVKMGYDLAEAKIILAKADNAIAKARLADHLTYLEQVFKRGMKDEVWVRGELARYGVAAAKIDGYLLAWTQTLKVSVPNVSQSAAEDWYQHDVITQEDYVTYLQALNYTEKDIMNYLTRAEQRKSAAAATAAGGA